MPNKKTGKITIDDPLIVYPYSPVAKPFPVPTITDICEHPLMSVTFPCALLPYVLGALEVWRWEDSFIGTLEERLFAAGMMRDLIGVFAMSARDCDCDPGQVIIRRINPDTGEIEISTDDGVTWQTDPESPYVQATQVAPLSGDDGDIKRCEAANNVVDNMKDVQARWSSYVGVLNNITDLLAAMVIDAALMLFIPVSVVALVPALTVIFAKIIEAAQIILGTTQEAYDLLFTEANWTIARCIIYCNVSPQGTFTDGAIVSIMAQMQQQITNPSPDAGDSMSQMIYAWGRVGTNNAAAIGAGTEGNCDDCTCGDCSNLANWTVVFGTVLEQTPGYIRLASVDNGTGQQSCRLYNWGAAPGSCCGVHYELVSGVATNQAWYACGSSDPVFSVPPPGQCMHDVNVVNVFNDPMVVEFWFTDCP